MEFTNQAKKALDDGKKVSGKLKQNYVGTEHVLIGLVRQTDSLASKVLTQAGVTEQGLIGLIEELISPGNGVVLAERDGYTPKLQKMIEQAEQEASLCGMDEIGTEHLLMAMLKMQDAAGSRILASMNVEPQKIFPEIISAMGREGITYRE